MPPARSVLRPELIVVVDQLLHNARNAGTATHGNLAHQIADHNVAEFLKKLETVNGILKRSVCEWRGVGRMRVSRDGRTSTRLE